MKLYTEEQVNKIAMQVKDYGYWNHSEITPIRLPSDEEVWEEANKEGNLGSDFAFARGAEFLKNKIQGVNNEQKVISETASTNTAKGFWVKDLKIQGGNK